VDALSVYAIVAVSQKLKFPQWFSYLQHRDVFIFNKEAILPLWYGSPCLLRYFYFCNVFDFLELAQLEYPPLHSCAGDLTTVSDYNDVLGIVLKEIWEYGGDALMYTLFEIVLASLYETQFCIGPDLIK
jgi:hypothetical protein